MKRKNGHGTPHRHIEASLRESILRSLAAKTVSLITDFIAVISHSAAVIKW